MIQVASKYGYFTIVMDRTRPRARDHVVIKHDGALGLECEDTTIREHILSLLIYDLCAAHSGVEKHLSIPRRSNEKPASS